VTHAVHSANINDVRMVVLLVFTETAKETKERLQTTNNE